MSDQFDFVQDDSEPVSESPSHFEGLPAAESDSGSVSAASATRRKRQAQAGSVALCIGVYVVLKLLNAM